MEDDFLGPGEQRKPAAPSSDDEEYMVHAILQAKRQSGGWVFLVSWADFDGDPTWEPARNVSLDMRKAFWMRVRGVDKPPSKACADNANILPATPLSA